MSETLLPLSKHAKDELSTLLHGPLPTQSYPLSIVRRLILGKLVERLLIASPFPKHGGRRIPHLQITDAGREALKP